SHHNGTFFAFQDHHWATTGLIGVTKCEDSPNALQAKLYLPLWIPHVKAVYDMVKFQIDSGNRMGLSIGYTPVKTAPGPNGARYLNEIALDEVSVTPFPMNTDAQITAVKSRKATYAKKAALWGRLKKSTPQLQNPDAAKTASPVGEESDDFLSFALPELKSLTLLISDHGRRIQKDPGQSG